MNCILLTFDRTYHYHTDERHSYLFSDIQKCKISLQNFQTDFEWNVAIFNRGEINVTLKTPTCTVNDRITFWGKSGWTNWNLCKFLNKQTTILISPAELISIINTLSFITSLHLFGEDNSKSCSSFSGFPGTAESCTTDL